MDRPPPTTFPGSADKLTPVRDPRGPQGPPPRPHTWSGHAEAGGALAQLGTQPAPLLTRQHAVPAWLAGAHSVLLPGAGLYLHLVWRGRQAAQGHSRVHRPHPPPCCPALPASPPPTGALISSRLVSSPPCPLSVGQKEHWPQSPKACSLGLAARHEQDTTPSTLKWAQFSLPPLLPAPRPRGAIEEDSVRQEENAADKL